MNVSESTVLMRASNAAVCMLLVPGLQESDNQMSNSFQFSSWVNSLFSLFALWGNKNWPPCMKVKKL